MSNKYIEQMVHQSRDSFTTANINLSLISKMISSYFAGELKTSAKANIQRLKNTLSNLNGLFEEVEILDQFELTVASDKLDDVNLLFLINKNLRASQSLIKEKHLNIHIASNSADTQLTSNPIIANYILKSVIAHIVNESAPKANIKIRCAINENRFEITFCELETGYPIQINDKAQNNHSTFSSEEEASNLNQVKLLASLLGGGLVAKQDSECSRNSVKVVFVDFSYQWPV